jgi:hypothetical protein
MASIKTLNIAICAGRSAVLRKTLLDDSSPATSRSARRRMDRVRPGLPRGRPRVHRAPAASYETRSANRPRRLGRPRQHRHRPRGVPPAAGDHHGRGDLSLDTESERAVKENIDRLLQGRTSFVIAHRLSTVRDADLIMVLEKGRLVEHGSHDDLMKRQGLYFYLVSQQLGL